ncbi:sporulation protein [Bacillus massilinigeriensis]|uniref:sporulation protein n=1 Tax=Bacillus massilionigeriensis TaxID=1805475 RepID=UPI00096B00F5|nr:sporulation protein [Bacillus massilionigeriensis]
MRRLLFVLMLFLTFLMSACNEDKNLDDSKTAMIKKTNPKPALISTNSKKQWNLIESIKHDVASVDEIYDVAVVKGKKDTLVVYKVKHLRRFHMKKIEKNVLKKLEKKYPKEKFTVSSDYKIFLEAVKLKEKIEEDPKFSDKQAEKELQDIIKLTEELT